MTKNSFALLIGAMTIIPAAAYAQTAAPATTAPAATTTPAASAAATPASGAGIAAGAKVVDQSGAPVGTIQSVSGDTVVLATAKSKVSLSKSSIAVGPNGPMIAMTAAQIDAAAAPAQAAQAAQAATAAKPNVTQGAAVTDTTGAPVGTVASVEGNLATVQLTTGTKVRLPVSGFAAGQNGGLTVAMTAQQLDSHAGATAATTTKK